MTRWIPSGRRPAVGAASAPHSPWGLRLWQCICIYGAMAYANSFAAWNLVSPAAESPKLFDQGHYWLPEVSKTLPDTLFFTLYIIFLVRWRHRHDVLRPFFFIAASLFFLRLLTFTATLVPPASPDIFVVKRGGPWVFLALYSQNTSTDYMFSAHTFHLTLFTALSLRHSRWWTDRLLVPIVALTGIVFVVASRLHYTSDVLVGFILTILMFATWELVETNRRLLLALSRSRERGAARRRAPGGPHAGPYAGVAGRGLPAPGGRTAADRESVRKRGDSGAEGLRRAAERLLPGLPKDLKT